MKNRLRTLIILGLILIFAGILRIHTFYIPHSHGDQVYYIGLAMKLEREGLKGYNLRSINTGLIEKDGSIVAVIPSKDNRKGRLLEGLEKSNVLYYSKESISNMPPAYSFLLMLSHKIFKADGLYTLVNLPRGAGAKIMRADKRAAIFSGQFYSVWISFIFSLTLIAVTFLLGRSLFNKNVGLIAAFLLAIAPVDILTSQRIWADDMAALFQALTILFFWLGEKRGKTYFTVFSGIAAGIACLTKGSGLFIVAIITIFFILKGKKGTVPFFINKNLFSIKKGNRPLFQRILFFYIACIAVCGFWYIKIATVYGTPFYTPKQEGIEYASSWFMMLANRPFYGQFIYFVYLSPILALFYWEAVYTFIKRVFTDERLLVLLWAFFYLAVLALVGGKEERYMLPAYPAICIFSALTLENVRLKINSSNNLKALGIVIVALVLILCAVWSIKLGLSCVLNDGAIFMCLNEI
ncbi:MAG: glycosyltransferase family 39 protein [Candidatus Omnitrophota bacterium]